MPTLLHQLPEDVLSIVAQRVVRNGETYWFGATCRAAWSAVLAACTQLEIKVPTSQLKTVYMTLPRLRAGLRLERVSEVVLADRTVCGADCLPQSMDGRYTWTPNACRAIVAGANIDVLNYVWPQWQRSISHRTSPICALYCVCQFNRIDLLDEMYSVEPSSNWDTQCLQRLVRLSIEGQPAARALLNDSMFKAIITGTATDSGEWLYRKLEHLSESIEAYGWRTWLSKCDQAHELVVSAVKAQSPYMSLRMLTGWMMPRFASRAPSERAVLMETIVHNVLATLSVGSFDSHARDHVWQWLAEAWPMGLAHLLRLIHSESSGIMGLSVSSMHRNCFRARDVRSYTWMREQLDIDTGWLYHAAVCAPHVVTWTVSSELATMRSNSTHGVLCAFAFHTFSLCMGKVARATDPTEKRNVWALCRAVVVEAHTDMLCTNTEPDLASASLLLGVSLHAFVESLECFQTRASADQRRLVFSALMPMIIKRVLANEHSTARGHTPGTIADIDDDDEQKSSVWAYISSLRREYNKEELLGNDAGGGRAAPF